MLLNEHPRVAFGIERYARVRRMVDRYLLTPERLVAPLSIETRVRGELLYERLAARISAGQVELTGDVDPAHIRAVPHLGSRLGIARAVVVLGEPPQSFVEQWRSAVDIARDCERRWFSGRVLVLPYGAFVGAEEPWLGTLLAFLELPPSDRLEEAYERLRSSAPAARSAPAGVDQDVGVWLEERSATELRRHSPDREAGPRVVEPPLAEDELSERKREREQLMRERRRGSEWDDHDSQALDRRYADQIREILLRGTTIARLTLTAAAGLPPASLRVTFLMPPTQPAEIGRENALLQLASHLGRLCAVRVIGAEPPAVPVADVEFQIERELSTQGVADGDVIIYPPELPRAAEALDGARAMMLLDGFTPPDDPQLLANLEGPHLVLAASRWLCELARERGARAILFPLGFSRTMFWSGAPNHERGLHVTGIAQTAERFGRHALSEAMVRVREARPEVDVTLIGGFPADGATKFRLHPPLNVVAETLRSSAIHVSAAHATGFDFVSAMALASGAALVTTDTGGSRDFAIHETTALVCPPGASGAMACHVLELLEQPKRRAELAANGAVQVHALLPQWPELARRLALIVGNTT